MSSIRLFASTLMLFSIACGADDDPPEPPPGPPGTARFAEATDEERAVALIVATGEASALAFTAVFMAEVDALQGECPVRTVDGSTVTYGGGEGCVTHDGIGYDGRVIAVNAQTFLDDPEYDPTLPTTLTFESFVRTEADAVAFDGTIEQSPVRDDESYRTASELTFGFGGLSATIALAMDCVEGSCIIDDASTGSIDGVGTFVIRGELGSGPLGLAGWVELEGEDLLRVELVEGRECSPVLVDGEKVGEVCHEPVDPNPIEELEFTGGGYACGDTMLTEGVVSGPATSVTIEITDASAGATEVHDLAPEGTDPITGGTIWRATLIPGEDLGFACHEVAYLDVTLRAESDQGATACYDLQGAVCDAT